MPNVYYQSDRVVLYNDDCLSLLPSLPANSVDMIFADPPYNLSNGGITCHAGHMMAVDKGAWDRSRGINRDHEFELKWLEACRHVLKDNGTIWISGTMHNIYSVGFALQRTGYKLLNEICWFKSNAPPNLSCRYFTHSHETVIWAAKSNKSKHKFNYKVIKELAGGKQMRSVWPDIDASDDAHDIWSIGAPSPPEKKYKKHPTQKPLALLDRIIVASSEVGDTILDPFAGSSTTGVAAILLGRRFIGIENSEEYLELSIKRLKDAEQLSDTFPHPQH